MKNKKRVVLVIAFLILFAVYVAVNVRGEYLQTLEIGEQYVEVFKQNLKYKVSVIVVNFAVLYIATYITTRFIKRGLKKFITSMVVLCSVKILASVNTATSSIIV